MKSSPNLTIILGKLNCSHFGHFTHKMSFFIPSNFFEILKRFIFVSQVKQK